MQQESQLESMHMHAQQVRTWLQMNRRSAASAWRFHVRCSGPVDLMWYVVPPALDGRQGRTSCHCVRRDIAGGRRLGLSSNIPQTPYESAVPIEATPIHQQSLQDKESELRRSKIWAACRAMLWHDLTGC